MNKRKFRILAIVASTPIIFFIVVFNVPIPINIDTYALEVVIGDSSHMVERTVTIRGQYRLNILVRYHEFRGEIIISGKDETNREIGSLHLYKSRHHIGFRDGVLIYGPLQVPDISYIDRTRSRVFGTIYVRGLFRDTMILHWREDYSNSLIGSPVIVLGATSRDEAVERILSVHPNLHYDTTNP